MIRNVDARLSRWSLALISLGYGMAAIAGEASLLPSSSDARYHAVGKLVAARHCTAALVAGSDTPDAAQSALLLTFGPLRARRRLRRWRARGGRGQGSG